MDTSLNMAMPCARTKARARMAEGVPRLICMRGGHHLGILRKGGRGRHGGGGSLGGLDLRNGSDREAPMRRQGSGEEVRTK